MARRRKRPKRSKYTKAGEDALAEVEAHQRSWVVIPVAEASEEEGLVTIRAPRFQSRAGKGLTAALKRDPEFNLHLDEFGSEAWRLFDGTRTVGEITDILAQRAGDEPKVALVRLLMFLRSLKSAGIIRVVTLESQETNV